MTETAASFAPQRDETWSLRARAIVMALRAYENSHPHDHRSTCLIGALREAECALGIGPKEDV